MRVKTNRDCIWGTGYTYKQGGKLDKNDAQPYDDGLGERSRGQPPKRKPKRITEAADGKVRIWELPHTFTFASGKKYLDWVRRSLATILVAHSALHISSQNASVGSSRGEGLRIIPFVSQDIVIARGSLVAFARRQGPHSLDARGGASLSDDAARRLDCSGIRWRSRRRRRSSAVLHVASLFWTSQGLAEQFIDVDELPLEKADEVCSSSTTSLPSSESPSSGISGSSQSDKQSLLVPASPGIGLLSCLLSAVGALRCRWSLPLPITNHNTKVASKHFTPPEAGGVDPIQGSMFMIEAFKSLDRQHLCRSTVVR
eukprot:g22047.t1